MNIVLADLDTHLRFAPLTLTRPMGALRMGVFTNEERWLLLLPSAKVFFETELYLNAKFKDCVNPDWKVNAAVIPSLKLIEYAQCQTGEFSIFQDGIWILSVGLNPNVILEFSTEKLIVLKERWDLFQRNGEVLVSDFNLLSHGRTSNSISDSNTLIGDSSLLFVEDGVNIEACILNLTNGPIYLGRECEVMEGSMIRGPFALCEGAVVKMGAKIYGPTTIGPFSRVGGELTNVIFQSYSNKGHDGFLGNSVLGEWCNLGADTNSSNLKNNYSKVSAYSFESQEIETTDVQFMGLIMGDHSKSGINTMFNTATVVGVSSNVYGADFPSKFIPSFKWGGASGLVSFQLDKAVQVAQEMMGRRGVVFSDGDQAIFEYLHAKSLLL